MLRIWYAPCLRVKMGPAAKPAVSNQAALLFGEESYRLPTMALLFISRALRTCRGQADDRRCQPRYGGEEFYNFGKKIEQGASPPLLMEAPPGTQAAVGLGGHYMFVCAATGLSEEKVRMLMEAYRSCQGSPRP